MLGRVQPAILDARFGIPGIVRFEAGEGGLTRAVATTSAATAHVYLHGAHVTHFQPVSSPPVLFTARGASSPLAVRSGGGCP